MANPPACHAGGRAGFGERREGRDLKELGAILRERNPFAGREASCRMERFAVGYARAMPVSVRSSSLNMRANQRIQASRPLPIKF
jgi:hypothetical protein